MGDDASMSDDMPAKSQTNTVPSRARGGAARAAKLSAEERSEISRKAAQARWDDVSVAVCGSADNPLKIGEVEIECYVLDDGTRVVTQASFLQALGRHPKANTRREAGGAPPILQGRAINPFIPPGVIEESQPITFRLPTGGRASGYRAELLPVVCEVYLEARDSGALPRQQEHVARQAEILVRGLARVGIIALVDEATGYQEVRARDALARILEEFVAKELQPWVRTFPDDFYDQLFRLRGLDYSAEKVQRPQYFGHLTNDIVYKRLAPGVLEELKRETPKMPSGRHRTRLHQRLTPDRGHPKLREHLASVISIMKLSSDWRDFKQKLDIIHPKYGETIPMDFGIDSGKGL